MTDHFHYIRDRRYPFGFETTNGKQPPIASAVITPHGTIHFHLRVRPGYGWRQRRLTVGDWSFEWWCVPGPDGPASFEMYEPGYCLSFDWPGLVPRQELRA